MTARHAHHQVAVELGDLADYQTILAALDKASLRPHVEIWEEWRALEKRRIAFAFETAREADRARGTLAAFIPR